MTIVCGDEDATASCAAREADDEGTASDPGPDHDAETSTVDPDLLADLEAQWRETAPERRRYIERLNRESPRGMILVVAAYGEAAVETLLRAACVKSGSPLKNLLGHQSAPLGSFSARIAACWCLGLLPEDEYVNLEQIRKLRNYAAHNLDAVSFEDDKVKGQIANLVVAADVENDPMSRLSYAIGGITGWVRFALPLIKTNPLAIVLKYAAADAISESNGLPRRAVIEHLRRPHAPASPGSEGPNLTTSEPET